MSNNNFGELLIYSLTPSDQNSVLNQVDWHVHEMCLLFSLVSNTKRWASQKPQIW